MPGSLQLAAPATVLPKSLCRSFTEQRAFPCDVSGPYVDGRSQRSPRATVSQRSWSLAKRLSYADWYTLMQFFEARKGALEPFFWYPLSADWDATGVSAVGRYVVVFSGNLSRTMGPGIEDVNLNLIEVS